MEDVLLYNSLKKIREEVKFDSIDLLKSQIKKDIEEAKKILD